MQHRLLDAACAMCMLLTRRWQPPCNRGRRLTLALVPQLSAARQCTRCPAATYMTRHRCRAAAWCRPGRPIPTPAAPHKGLAQAAAAARASVTSGQTGRQEASQQAGSGVLAAATKYSTPVCSACPQHMNASLVPAASTAPRAPHSGQRHSHCWQGLRCHSPWCCCL
jgi:hypothetical protein